MFASVNKILVQMKIKIGKHFSFDASHQLPPNHIYGKCQNLHGHTYHLTVEIEGEINDHGWICNFSEVKEKVKELVLDQFDHKHLNEFFDLPTAEVIAQRIFHVLDNSFKRESKSYQLSKVILYETPTSYCEVTA